MMKNWKRIVALAMSTAMASAMLTSCGGGDKTTEAAKGNEPEAEAGTQADKDTGGAADSGEKKQVYMFIRGRGDLSYWDSMAAGGDRTMAGYANRADVHAVETATDLQANLQAVYRTADKGADLIITASDFEDNLVEIANEYPDIAFTIISGDMVDRCGNNNTYGMDFATGQAAFLGGIATADVATNDAEDMDPTSVIGFINSMNESLAIQELLWGYIRGTQCYSPDIKIVHNYVGAWNDPDAAKTQAMTQYNDVGTDVIFTCTGGSGNGVHNVAEETQKFVIDVDSGQSQLYEDDKAIQEKFLTSIVKEADSVVYNVIGEYLDNGTPPYGEYGVPGLSGGAVNIVEGDQLNGALPDEGKAELEEAKARIADGSIGVKSATGRGRDEVKAFINENYQ